MTESRRRLLLSVWAFLVFGLSVRAFAHGLLSGAIAPAPVAVPLTVDLNRASVGELTTLPGIGLARAEAIVLDRVRRGPFRVLEDLDRVDGFGPQTCASIQPYVVPLSAAVATGSIR